MTQCLVCIFRVLQTCRPTVYLKNDLISVFCDSCFSSYPVPVVVAYLCITPPTVNIGAGALRRVSERPQSI